MASKAYPTTTFKNFFFNLPAAGAAGRWARRAERRVLQTGRLPRCLRRPQRCWHSALKRLIRRMLM